MLGMIRKGRSTHKKKCNKVGYYWSGLAHRLLLQFVNEDQVLYFLYFPDTDDIVNKPGLSCAKLRKAKATY